MSLSANIQSVVALEELGTALKQFEGSAHPTLQTARQYVRQTVEWLQHRLDHWRIEVQRAQEELRLAEATLARCRAAAQDPRTGSAYVPTCAAEQQAIQQARVRLQKAQEEFGNVQRWKFLVDEAASAYSVQAQQVQRRLDADVPNAIAFLGGRIGELQAYLTTTSPPTVSLSVPAAPSVAGKGTAGQAVIWMDTGIQSVEVDQIDLSDSSVADTSDFHKVPVNEMQAGLRRLQDEVAPAVARGADGDYFSRLDAARGLDYAHGYRRIYDAFYGQSCIRLNQVGDHYLVVNGYHRLFVARQMGITTLPARVIAPST